MNYNSKIRDSRNKAYDHHIATKILDLMAKLRMDNEQSSSRRWIWELLQNAKDVVQDNGVVNIEIDFHTGDDNGSLNFSHTGRPFSIDNITFLIEQVSTKERKKSEGVKPKTTGKFGTGFLTTHLLSEIVDVEGVVKEPGLPYRKFKLQLDRTGRDIDVIIESVNRSLATLDNIDVQSEYDQYADSAYNTSFTYKLGPEGIDVAKVGLADLTESLPYALVFIPEIQSVNLKFENLEFSIQSDSSHFESLTIYSICKKSTSGEELLKIAVLIENGVSVALPINITDGKTISVVELSPKIPRIFCDFPLVGSEEIMIPFIVNSSFFNPNEPRSGVYLTDKADLQIEENKTIFKTAVSLFVKVLDIASKNSWENIHLLAKIKRPKPFEWLSPSWFSSEVFEPITLQLQITPIVLTESGRRREIKNTDGKDIVWFPFSAMKEVRDAIWQLASTWIPEQIPKKEDLEFWEDIIWDNCARLKLETIAYSVSTQGSLEKLGAMLKENPQSTLMWLNDFYAVLTLEGAFINEIVNDKYAIIPNQNGVFKKKSHLSSDDNIDEELKNCLSILNIDCRDYLAHSGVKTGSISLNGTKTQQYVIDEINRTLKEGKNPNIFEACSYLITLFSDDPSFPKKRQKILDFYRIIYPNSTLTQRNLERWTENIWIDADRLILRWFVGVLGKQKNVYDFAEYAGFPDSDQTIIWLNGFISFLVDNDSENLINLKLSPVLPTQNGSFRIKDDLFLDDGEIPEILKDISMDLGYDFRNEMLDQRIYLELPPNRTKTASNVSEEIIRLISPRFSELPRLDSTKQIFRKLYLWINGHKDQAKALFGELYNNKHKLFDDDEIAQSIQNSEEYTDLLEEFGISDINNLRQILLSTADKSRVIPSQGEIITQDVLVSLGISSIKELEEALQDQNLASRFMHAVTPTFEMFQYVHSLIERSKNNIIAYLKSDREYDCTDIQEVATTVLAGVKKDGLSIHIVVRPSDNGEVIIYYNSEKDTLDYTNAELWIDNGRDTPEHLTLGRILKTTGITRIPV